MPKDFDYLAEARAAGERVKTILEKEGAQAKALFDRIVKRHGLGTAKALFERCINLAPEPTIDEERQQYAAAKAQEKAAQNARSLAKLPTLEQITAANRDLICKWYYSWPDRKLEEKEYKIYCALLRRYIDVGGYPKDFNPSRLPPTKKRGSVMRESPNAQLPRLYDEEKAKRDGELTETAFAAIHAKRTGESPENVRKKLSYHLKRRKT
jgi:hypothetical protein